MIEIHSPTLWTLGKTLRSYAKTTEHPPGECGGSGDGILENCPSNTLRGDGHRRCEWTPESLANYSAERVWSQFHASAGQSRRALGPSGPNIVNLGHRPSKVGPTSTAFNHIRAKLADVGRICPAGMWGSLHDCSREEFASDSGVTKFETRVKRPARRQVLFDDLAGAPWRPPRPSLGGVVPE